MTGCLRMQARKAFCASIAVGKGQKPPQDCDGDCFRCAVTEPIVALEAAIKVIVPMVRARVVEECAKVAERSPFIGSSGDPAYLRWRQKGADDQARRSSAAIRELKGEA
jgi:hypothetical protein